MASPDVYAAVEHGAGAALARARKLMTILDEPHHVADMYARMRAVRQELETLSELFDAMGIPGVEVANLPPLAKPSGEQQDLTDPDQCLDITVVRDRVPRDLLGNPLQ